jgi:hypothetical protein
VQEHDTAGLKAKGDALVGQQVIIGYSAANFIAQGNGAGSRTLAPGVELGAISNNGSGTDLGVPYTGTAPNLEPVPSFYNDSVFGRNVYNVFDTARVTGFGNDDLKSLFVGPSSALCSTEAVNVSETFGYAPVASCGSTALTGSLISGIQ